MENNGIVRAAHNGGADTAAPPAIDSSTEEFGWEDFNPRLDGGSQGGDLWLDVVSEVALGEPPAAVEKFTDAEEAIISVAVRRFKRFGGRTTSAVGGKTDHTGYVTSEDFEEGPAREAFLLCYGHAWHLLGDKKPEDSGRLSVSAQRALSFYFCHDPEVMTFEDAGAAMSEDIRRDVVRLRFMYEFWLSWMVLPPMPFNFMPLPGLVEDMASTTAGLEGVGLAHVIWQNPGIAVSEAIFKTKERLDNIGYDSSEEELLAALNALMAEYLVSRKYLEDPTFANLYLTGANPEQEIKDKSLDPDLYKRVQRSTIWWSRLFSE